MFSFNPELAATDAYEEGDEAFDSYARNEDEEDNNEVSIIYFNKSQVFFRLAK